MGNQMFLYALYKSFEHRGTKVAIDDHIINTKQTNYIKDFFKLKYNTISRIEHEAFFKQNSRYRNLMMLLYRTFVLTVKNWYFDPYVFKENVLDIDNKYFFGYFQSEKYFDDPEVKQQLRKDFSMPENYPKSQTFKDLEKEIKNNISVSIHCRRGDYLAHTDTFGGICTDTYYENAINYVKERYPECRFYCFSDDKEYIKEKFGDRFTIVNQDNTLSSTDEFYLMSYCKHNIIANSTFSWWASWLNDNKDKLILAPEKWFANRDFDIIYTDNMTKISIE